MGVTEKKHKKLTSLNSNTLFFLHNQNLCACARVVNWIFIHLFLQKFLSIWKLSYTTMDCCEDEMLSQLINQSEANLETIQQSQYQCQRHRHSLNGPCGLMSLVYVPLTLKRSHCYYGWGKGRDEYQCQSDCSFKFWCMGLSSSGNLWLGEAWATQRDQDLGWPGVFECPLVGLLQAGASAP